jgi:dTDP-4-amino-4,6-dideoxygalactose transaminase
MGLVLPGRIAFGFLPTLFNREPLSLSQNQSIMKDKIWLSSPHMGDMEQVFVREAFDTNWIAPLGPHVNGFEEDLQSYTGAGHAAALSSGTAALHLALILAGVKAGDEVICQSFTFSASANPIVYQGARPVFVDSEAETWNMSPEFLEEAILRRKAKGDSGQGSGWMGRNAKADVQPDAHRGMNGGDGYPKAIIAVHLYGMPAKMPEIRAIADRYGIPVIEDAAEALGSRIGDRRCGSFGDSGILSFNGNKIITTSGGGALLSDDEAMIRKARFLATQARDPAPHYQHSHIGYNYRMSNVLAGIGRGQMRVLDDRVEARRLNFERYRDFFESVNRRGYQVELLPEPEGYFSNRWLTTVLIDHGRNQGISREKVRLALEEANIESRPLWKPMHLQPVFADCPFYGDGTAERLFKNGLCLPSGSNLSSDDWSRIMEALESVFK